LAATRGRAVDALLANAVRGLGGRSWSRTYRHPARAGYQCHRHTLSISSTASEMKCGRRGKGRILITESVAGFIPGWFQAV
jgi:hypothetical protein